MATGSAKIYPLMKSFDYREALDRVGAWTRERFKLDKTATVLVTEIACRLPGCAPLETVVAFWADDDKRHQFKIFKPVQNVVVDDLPPAWLKDSLAVPEGFGCDCC